MKIQTTLATLVAMTLFLASAMPVMAENEEDPVVTALITFPGSAGDLVLTADDGGNYTASVALYQLLDGEWEQIELRATLRVFADDHAGSPQDLLSIGFDSAADEATNVTIPGDLPLLPLDVFVTFSGLGQSSDGTVPTSHHHIVKNVLIDLGQYDQATDFNGPSHRVFAL